MINVQFIFSDDREPVTVYDVHPRSQANAIPVPDGAAGFIIWLGTK